MSRALALLLIGLVFGGGIGFVIAAANGVTLDGHDHATDHAPAALQPSEDGEAAHHDHSETVDATGAVPTLEIDLVPDPVAGWNLSLSVSNFAFAPEASGRDHVDGEGHAHLYANGVKLARIYGPWFHIGALPDGNVEVVVTLNSNDHRAIAVDGVPVRATHRLTNTP